MSFIEKIKGLWEIQRLRYTKKGPKNIILAVSLLIGILYISRNIGCYFWPSQIQSKQLYIIKVAFTIHFIFQIFFYLLYLPGYSNALKSYEGFRINKGVKRPWEDNSKWPQQRIKLFLYLGINYIIVFPIILYLPSQFSEIQLRFQNFPSTLQLGLQLIFISFVEDAGFYWAHRLAHENKFFYNFHKIHHEHTEIYSLVTEYFHPVDYIIGVLVKLLLLQIPAGLPFIFLGSRAHCFTFFFWQVWRMTVSTEGHSGYYFPWSPSRIFFFVSDPSYHNFHHTKNVGNYCGYIYLWDYFNDSSKEYFKNYKLENAKKLT